MEGGLLYIVHYDVRVSEGQYSQVNLQDLGWGRWSAWGVGEIGVVNLNYFNDPVVTGCRLANRVDVSIEIARGDTVSLCQLFASADSGSRLDAFGVGPTYPGTDPRDRTMVWSTSEAQK